MKKDTNDPKEYISHFFELVYIQHDIENKTLWDKLLYLPEDSNTPVTMDCYKTMLYETVNQHKEAIIHESIKIWRYDQYPKKSELKSFPSTETANIYVLQNNGKASYYFLVKEGKIVSWLSMQKGERHFFLTCTQ